MRINNLQALRGLGCLLVFFVHLACWECIDGKHVPTLFLSPLMSFGFAGLDLFFVLSGFVITWVNLKHLGNPSQMAGYLGRRLWRVYPIYWILWCATFLLVLDRFAPHLGGYFNRSRVARFLLLVPNTDTNTVLPQAWTLCFEVEFYVIFALFFLVPRRWFVPLLALWLATTAGAGFYLDPYLQPSDRYLQAARWLVHPRIVEFIFGCLIAVAARRGFFGLSRASLALGVAGFALGGWICYAEPDATLSNEARVLLFSVPSLLVVHGAVAIERSRGWVMPVWLQLVGEASYSIYLVHLTAFEFLQPHVSNWLRVGWGHWAYLAVMSAAGLAAGFLVHFIIERPLMTLANRRRSTPPTIDRDSDVPDLLPIASRLPSPPIPTSSRRSA